MASIMAWASACLLRRGEVDAAAVLRARVVALPVQRGRVVDQKEHLQDLAKADLCRVVLQLDNLVVAGGTGAHLLVARLQCVAIAVARLHVGHALDLDKHRLGAPEAAAAQGQGLNG
jgi:hypothetical protein